MKTLKLSLLLSFLCLGIFAFAQTEICNNGIDDDLDGLCDATDPDCPSCTFWPIFSDMGGNVFTAPLTGGNLITFTYSGTPVVPPIRPYNALAAPAPGFCPDPLVPTSAPPNMTPHLDTDMGTIGIYPVTSTTSAVITFASPVTNGFYLHVCQLASNQMQFSQPFNIVYAQPGINSDATLGMGGTWITGIGSAIDASATLFFPGPVSSVNITFPIVGSFGDGITLAFTFPEACQGCNIQAAFNVSGNNDPYAFTDMSTVTGTDVLTFWDFGDGQTSTDANPTHTYTQTGSYIVCLNKMALGTNGEDICCDKICSTIVVENVDKSCVAKPDFTYTSSGLLTQFNNTSIYNTTANYVWTFDDGTTSTDENPTHIYSGKGTYRVCLAVFSTSPSGSCCNRKCYDITVEDGAPKAAAAMAIEAKPKTTEALVTNAKTDQMNILPNPTSGEFVVAYKLETAGAATLYITSTTGEMIKKQQLNAREGKIPLNMSTYAGDTYYISISSGLKVLASQKLVLTK